MDSKRDLKRGEGGRYLPFTDAERRESEERKKRQCPICFEMFLPHESRQKFCSHSCAATFNNLNRTTGGGRHNTRCPRCNQKCKNRKQTYCSKKCRSLHLLEKWLDGENPVKGWGQVPEVIRQYLLEEVSYSCSKCGWNKIHPVTGSVPLEINHIDGDSQNNTKSNLEVLCPNCHSLTPTFRNLNPKGKGRRRGKRS